LSCWSFDIFYVVWCNIRYRYLDSGHQRYRKSLSQAQLINDKLVNIWNGASLSCEKIKGLLVIFLSYLLLSTHNNLYIVDKFCTYLLQTCRLSPVLTSFYVNHAFSKEETKKVKENWIRRPNVKEELMKRRILVN
jgi:hypothetical protein